MDNTGFMRTGGAGSASQVTMRAAFLLAVAGTIGLVGCASQNEVGLWSTGASRQGGSQETAVFAPVTRPADFDAAHARMTLAEVPGDPPAPTTTQPAAGGLPAPALRYMGEAERLFSEQRFTETILELDKVLRYSATSAEAHRLMALACFMSGNEARAKMSAERALSLRQNDLTSHYVLGRFAEKSGKPDEAMRRYRLGLKCPPVPQDASWRLLTSYYLGLLLETRGYYTAAVTQLRGFQEGVDALGEKVQENPELATVVRVQRGATALRLARAEAVLGDYAAAADALRIASTSAPRDVEIRMEYIRMLGRAGKKEEAATAASRLVADTQGNHEAVSLLLAVHRALGQPERGVQAIREILLQQPDNIDLHLLLADALVSAKRENEAVQVLQSLISRNPEAASARWKLMEIERRRGAWDAWMSAMAAQIAARPADAGKAIEEIARLDAAAAGKALEQGQRSSAAPSTAPADAARLAAARAYVLARLSMRLERPDEAARFYEEATRQNPAFLPAIAGVADAHLQNCRWTEAIDLLEKTAKSRGETAPELERLLGRAFDGMDDIENAVAHYERAIQLERGDLESMLALARLYERTGQIPLAQRQYRAAVAAAPNDLRLREGLVHVLLVGMNAAQTPADQQSALTRVLGELTDMQRIAAQAPATLRCTALVRFLGAREREPEEARKLYVDGLRKLIKDKPEDLQTREDLVKVLFEFREYSEARVVASEMLARNARSPEANELAAAAMTRVLALDEAAEQYQRMLACHPNREAWIRQFADLRLIEQDYDAASALINRSLALKGVQGKPERMLLYRARLMETLIEARRGKDARGLAESWLKEAGQDERFGRLYRMFVLAGDAAAGDYARYIQRCESWLEAKPDSPDVRQWLLLGLVKAGKAPEAGARVLSWLAKAPDADEQIGALVEVLATGGHVPGAIELIRSQIATADRPEERLGRMLALNAALMRAGKYDEAITVLKELISQGNRVISQGYMSVLRKSLAQALSQAGRGDEAIALLNSMLQEVDADREKDGDDERKSELLRVLSMVHQRQGRRDIAEQRLREAHQLTPTEIGVNNDLGYTLVDTGREIEEASRMIRLALGEEPRQLAYLDSYGWALYKAGDFAGATAWLRRAASAPYPSAEQFLERIRTNPSAGPEENEDAVILDHLGDAQWRLGEKEAAVQSWKRARQLHEKQAAQGEEPVERELAERLTRKLEAAARGASPPVAPIAPQTQPAAGTRPQDTRHE